MILTEEKLKTKERKEFGIPELKKYPMPDKEHVLAAIRMFNHVDKEHEKELANNIKWSSQKAIMFEAGIIKACMEVNVVPQNVVLQEQVVNRKQIAPVQKQENIAVAPKERKIEPQNQRNSAPSASYWNNVINKVKQSGKMAIYVNLIGSKASQLNDMTVEVELANKNDFGREMLEKYENKALVEKFVSEEMRKSYAFKIYY